MTTRPVLGLGDRVCVTSASGFLRAMASAKILVAVVSGGARRDTEQALCCAANDGSESAGPGSGVLLKAKYVPKTTGSIALRLPLRATSTGLASTLPSGLFWLASVERTRADWLTGDQVLEVEIGRARPFRRRHLRFLPTTDLRHRPEFRLTAQS